MPHSFKIGDKVLLIHTGEVGLVKDFVNMYMLKIELDDEMVLPVFMDDLEIFDAEKKELGDEPIADTKEIINEVELYFTKHQHNAISGFHLSFMPVEIDDVHFFEMILVNDTNDDIRFEIKLSLQNELYMHLRNRLQRRYIYRLGDLAMDELNENPTIEITIEHASHPLFQVNKQFKLKPKSFFCDLSSTPILKETAYNYHFGILQNISEKINAPIHINAPLAQQVERRIKENYKKPTPEKHRHYYIEDTIDLHIENLIDNHNGMTNAEIINIQLRHFRKALEDAMVHKLAKFTVVHGIGKGKLKAEIWEILRQYGGIRSFQNEYHHKFGFGATEIYFR